MIDRGLNRTYKDISSSKYSVNSFVIGYNCASASPLSNKYKLYISIQNCDGDMSMELSEEQARDLHEQLGAMLDIPPFFVEKPPLGISGQDFTKKD